MENTQGAFHYAKLTGQRSVGIPEENGTAFSDKTGPTNWNGSCHFKFFFRIPLLGQRTGLSKMERQISVGIFRPKYVDHLQRWSRIFRSEETETDLSIWIPTEITGIFGIMESTPRSSTFSGNFPVEQTEKSCSIYNPAGISGISW